MISKKLEKEYIQDIVALTPMQEGMLFHYLKDPGTELYFEQLLLELQGTLDMNRFEKAWQFVVDTNEMLRTIFRWDKIDKPLQIIKKYHPVTIRYFDLTSGESDVKSLSDIITSDRQELFNLHEVPFRVSLCKIDQDKHSMIMSNHHILYDGWSTGIILKEFFRAYNTKGTEQIIKSSFKDFVKVLQTKVNREEEEKFWKNYLLSNAEILDTNDSRGQRKRKPSARRARRTGQYRFQFPLSLVERLSIFVKKEQVTLASFLTTAWGLLLQKYNSCDDIIFDTTVSGRNAKIKGIEDLVGMFINTLPLRVRTNPSDKVAQLTVRHFSEAKERENFENTSHTDINEYIETFKRRKELLFDSVIVLENYPLDRQLMQEKGDLTVGSFSIVGRTQYDLTIIITTFEDINLDIAYNKDLFDEELLSVLCLHFTALVEEVAKYPNKPVLELEFIPVSELDTLRERLSAVCQLEEGGEVVYIAPRNQLEEKLVILWSELLKIEKERIGIDHDFFEFGGHSLKAGLLVSRVHRDFKVKVPLEEVFKHSTVRKLSAYIRIASGEEEYKSIQPILEQDFYELSSVQKRIYALQQLDPSASAYNVSSVIEMQGDVNTVVIKMFEEAFNQLIKRHESLRTSFQLINGEPKQKIHSPDEFTFILEYKEPFKNDSGTIKDSFQEVEKFIRPFDLSKVPLMRACIVKIDIASFLFILDMHHIITDGFSMDIFIREFAALCKGEALTSLKNQYKDYSQWQYSRLQSGQLLAMEEYWLKEFSGEIPVLDIMTDFPRPSVQRFEGDRIYFTLGKKVTGELHRLMRETGSTIFIVLLTALYILLHRYTGQEDIVIGTTVSGRRHPTWNLFWGYL